MSADRTDVRIVGTLEAVSGAQRGALGADGVLGRAIRESPLQAASVTGSAGQEAGGPRNADLGVGDPRGYEVRCPHCHALQFLARERWECVAIDQATVAIKCWRRTCKMVLGLRPVEGSKLKVEGCND